MSLLGRSLLAAEVPGGESLRDAGAPLDGDLPLDIDVAGHLSEGQPFLFYFLFILLFHKDFVQLFKSYSKDF